MSAERVVDLTSLLKEGYDKVSSQLQSEHDRQSQLSEVDLESHLKRARLEGRMFAIVDIARRIGVERAVLPPHIISFNAQQVVQEI